MYACMHVCMYVCMHVCMYVNASTSITLMFRLDKPPFCAFLRKTCVCMYVCMYSCTHVWFCEHGVFHASSAHSWYISIAHACMYVCIYTHIYTHAHRYIDIYIPCTHACIKSMRKYIRDANTRTQHTYIHKWTHMNKHENPKRLPCHAPNLPGNLGKVLWLWQAMHVNNRISCIILYIRMRSPLCLLSNNVVSSKASSLLSFDRFLIDETSSVALCCTLSISSQSDLWLEDQTGTANSKNGRIKVRYKDLSNLQSTSEGFFNTNQHLIGFINSSDELIRSILCWIPANWDLY
jgi:hypothetical protein